MRKNHLDALAMGLLVACCAFWGLQQVLAKATLAEVAPVFQAALRFAIASAALAAWCRWRGIALWLRDGSRPSGLAAGLLFAGEFACIYLGLQFTPASRLTVLLYTAPIWVAVLLPRWQPQERLRGWQWAGLACAFCGVLLALADHGTQPVGPKAWVGDLLGLAGGLLWALTTLVLRSTPVAHAAPERQLAYQLGTGALLLPLVSLALGERWSFALSPFATASVLAQSLVGAFASYLAWMWMLGRYPATQMGSFVFLTPVFALVFGAWWLGEAVTPGLLGALALVAAGIVLVGRRGPISSQNGR